MREQLLAAEKVTAIAWREGALHLLDQRLLPFTQTWLAYDSAAAVAEAIRLMVVRGAPAIGIAAAYAVVLAVRGASAVAPPRRAMRSFRRSAWMRRPATRPFSSGCFG